MQEMTTKLHNGSSHEFQPPAEANSPKFKGKHLKMPVRRRHMTPDVRRNVLDRIEEESYSYSPTEQLVTVEDPFLMRIGWFSSYYAYTVTTRTVCKYFTVKRRFSDLDWMHQGLVNDFKGHRIPPRPCKSILPDTEEFIEQRRAEMQIYLNVIAEDPVLSNSVEFRVFTQSSAGEFSKQKSLSFARTQEKVSFEDKFASLLASMSNLIHRKSCCYDRNVQEIKESLKKLQSPVQAFSAAFAHWASCSSGSSEKAQCFQDLLFGQDSRGLWQQFSTSLQDFTVKIQLYSLKYESLKQAFVTYKSSVQEYSKLESLVTRQVAKHRESQSSKHLARIQNAQAQMTRLSNEITAISANIASESECLATAQATQLSSTIEFLVSSVKSHYEAESAFWDSLPKW